MRTNLVTDPARWSKDASAVSDTGRPVLRGRALVDAIRTEIVEGRLAPGERLAEPFLAERYEVSRVPVREALRVLAAEGFVTLRPHGGAAVQLLTKDTADEVMAVRQMLEPFASRTAAAHRVRDDLVQLRDILEAGRRSLHASDLSPIPRLNTEFHVSVGRATGNSIIASMVQQIAHKTEWVYSAVVQTRACFSWDEHWAIYDAIVAQDAERAERLMALHVDYTKDALPAALERVATAAVTVPGARRQD